MKWELVIVWATGETDVFPFATADSARNAGRGMVTALGNQIDWFGVREKVR